MNRSSDKPNGKRRRTGEMSGNSSPDLRGSRRRSSSASVTRTVTLPDARRRKVRIISPRLGDDTNLDYNGTTAQIGNSQGLDEELFVSAAESSPVTSGQTGIRRSDSVNIDGDADSAETVSSDFSDDELLSELNEILEQSPQRRNRSSATRRTEPIVLDDESDKSEAEERKSGEIRTVSDTEEPEEDTEAAPSVPMEHKKKLSLYECPVCLCAPDKVMVITCGHVFCSDCLYRCVESATSVAGRNGLKGSTDASCPMCRKRFKYSKTIPLQLKLGPNT